MKKRIILSLLCAALLFMGLTASSQAADKGLFHMKTCWQPEHSTFIMWEPLQKGWFKEAGLDVEMLYFESGMAQIEVMPAKQWVLGGTGSVPMLLGAMRYGAYMIGIANDDTVSVGVMVRPDSPILKQKGANPDFPETYGSADSVRGKTVLVTTVSNGHYALSTWLKRLGLTDADVVIKNMDQGQILAAYESGIGDIAVFWAPSTFIGMSKGWVMVNKDSQKGHNMVNVIIAEKKFADENPEKVARFLKVYMRGVDEIKKENVNMADAYSKFLQNWAGVELSPADAAMDIKYHPVYTLQEQLSLFNADKGKSEAEQWMTGMADFLVAQGKFTREEMDKALNSGFVTDKFLKIAAEMK